MELPVVEGLTETAIQSLPLHEQLAEFLAQRPGASGDDVAKAMTSLESAFKREGDERMKTRIALALSCLRGDHGDDEGEGKKGARY